MNKIIITIFALCLVEISVTAHSQEHIDKRGFNREAFIVKRNAYITAKAGLTPDEAMKFIPLCNELQMELMSVALEYRKRTRALMQSKTLTEEDYKKVLDEGIELRLKQASLEKEYYERFKKILSYKKLYKYKVADDKFMKEFMRNKHRRQIGVSLKDSNSSRNSIKEK